MGCTGAAGAAGAGEGDVVERQQGPSRPSGVALGPGLPGPPGVFEVGAAPPPRPRARSAPVSRAAGQRRAQQAAVGQHQNQNQAQAMGVAQALPGGGSLGNAAGPPSIIGASSG